MSPFETPLSRTLVRVFACLLAAFGAPAYAKDDFAQLDPDEGLLLFAVDNGIGASSVRIEGPGTFDDDVANRLKVGRNVRLMRFPAGKYRWSKVNLGPDYYYYYRMDHKPTFEFTIEPGVINYPGELTMQPAWQITSYFQMLPALRGPSIFGRYDRASMAMMLLDIDHPGVRARYRWRNDLPAPDPFPGFFAVQVPAERMAGLVESAEADARKSREIVVDDAFTDAFNELFSPPIVSLPGLSPDGSLLAYVESRQKDAKHTSQSLIVVDVESGTSLQVPTSGGVNDIEWADDRLLLADTANGVDRLRFAEGPLVAKSIDSLSFPGVSLLDALPEDAGRAIVSGNDDKGEWHLYALDKKARRYDASQFKPKNRIDRDLASLKGALVDPSGMLRAAVVADKEGKRSLVARTGGTWKTLRELPVNDRWSPLMLSADGASVVVLTNEARGQVDLVRVALDTGAVIETLLSVPGTDIESALLRRRDRAVLGGLVYRGGTPSVEYLDKGDGDLVQRIAAGFPGASVVVWDESRDKRRAIALVRTETNRGTYYLYDAKEKKLEKLFDATKPFEKVKPAASTAFSVRTPDGLDVRAFLTLPTGGAQPWPLVVMPHGGPFGVRDTQTFDPTVQLLAHGGFAVLRVNYRGSGGAGRAFEEAGHGQQGREIEADVERALDHALANFPLDRGRVALLGASYGGYSTLMGLIRAPARFRCGVAISAVTDLMLAFSSSDWTTRPESVAYMKRVLGDPAIDAEALKEKSPVYQYAKLTQPLLLIHGTNDVRVSFEHAWRLRTLLANAGRPPEWLPLGGADHSLSRPNDRLAMHVASDRFLRECLKPAGR